MRTTKIILFLSTLLACMSAFASKYNMTQGVTEISREIYNLHMIVIWICVGIGVVVFSVMFYAIFKHRKSKGAVAADFHEHPVLEMVWAVVPFIILVLMAVPATKVLLKMEDSSEADITVKITGFQWKWKYEYLDEGIQFFSNLATTQDEIKGKVPKKEWYLLDVDNRLVLPINQKVRFLITSNDVIHSWWLPAFGIKKDAVPGFIHEVWARIETPGIYRGQCAELCGANHAYMPIVVEAKTEEDYEKWVIAQAGEREKVLKLSAKKAWTKEELMAKGKQDYETNCGICHKPDGKGMPPAFPALVGSDITVGPKDKHIDIVVKGVAGTAMQAFGAQLSDADIAAIITYQRNSWGNDDKKKYGENAGGMIQPSEVKKAK